MKKWIMGVIAGIVAFISLYFKGKSVGKQEQEAKENEKILDDVKKVSSSRNNSDNLTRVRKKYTRK